MFFSRIQIRPKVSYICLHIVLPNPDPSKKECGFRSAILLKEVQKLSFLQSIDVDVKRVEETGNKLVNSQISEEALVLSADPSKQEVSVKSRQQMSLIAAQSEFLFTPLNALFVHEMCISIKFQFTLKSYSTWNPVLEVSEKVVMGLCLNI